MVKKKHVILSFPKRSLHMLIEWLLHSLEDESLSMTDVNIISEDIVMLSFPKRSIHKPIEWQHPCLEDESLSMTDVNVISEDIVMLSFPKRSIHKRHNAAETKGVKRRLLCLCSG